MSTCGSQHSNYRLLESLSHRIFYVNPYRMDSLSIVIGVDGVLLYGKSVANGQVDVEGSFYINLEKMHVWRLEFL